MLFYGDKKMKLYLLLQIVDSGKQFFKYFDIEYEMDKFKRKLKYSKRLMIIEDSRDLIYDYNI